MSSERAVGSNLRRWMRDVARSGVVVGLVVAVAVVMDLLGAIDLSRRLMSFAVAGLAAFFAGLDRARRRESRSP